MQITALNVFAYMSDVNIYRRFNLNENEFRHKFDFPNYTEITSSGWISVQSDGENLKITATPTSDFATVNDYIKSGPCGDPPYYDARFEVIFQWDQRDNIDINADQQITANILQNYERTGGYAFQDDEDIFCFTPTQGAYCLEFDENSNVKLAISYDGNTYTEYEIKDTVKTFQSTTLKYKRAYKIDWEKHHKYYIKIHGDYSSAHYFDNQHNYSFTIKEVKPTIFVHGIFSNPTYEGDIDTAFEGLKENISLIPELDPTWVFDFPWDAHNGIYTNYCGKASKNGTLHHYLKEKCDSFDSEPIIVAHSMGGMLVLKQVEVDHNFLGETDDLIFFATPFAGSDIVEFPGAGLITLTSSENVERLKRGTRYTWELMESAPSQFANHETFFFCGSKDWCVNVCSANLPGILSISGDAYSFKMDHRHIKNFSFPCEGNLIEIFEKVIYQFKH